jgi:amino acid transporter
MAVAWYIFIVLAVSLAMPADALSGSSLAVADSMSAVFGGAWAGKLIVIAGIGGIVTSWNAFLVGGSRAVYAMAHAKMLPDFLAKLHPTYNTPINAILMVGALSVVAPLFGRPALVWLVDAGGLGIVVAYAAVAASFLVLRKREPDMPRPFRVPRGEWVGWGALVLAVGIVILYLPGSPAALIWPYEWAIVGGWTLLGLGFYLWARTQHGAEADRLMRIEIASSMSGDPA